MLALTFANPADYDKIHPRDTVSLVQLRSLAEGKPVQVTKKKQSVFLFKKKKLKQMVVHPHDGKPEFSIMLNHTFNAPQIAWFHAGSALNYMKTNASKKN
jgi:aconitate hydratase